MSDKITELAERAEKLSPKDKLVLALYLLQRNADDEIAVTLLRRAADEIDLARLLGKSAR